MAVLVYDETFVGFLSSVYAIFEKKLEDVRIQKKSMYQPQIFDDVIHIISDEKKSTIMWQYLFKKLSKDSLLNLYSCYLSELPDSERIMLSFIKLILCSNSEKQFDYGDQIVLRVAQIGKLLFREKHRFEAFVRFQRLQDDLYFATIEPDFNVIPLIVRHFKNRYADQKWLIYDNKRKYGIYFDLSSVSEVRITEQNDSIGTSDKDINYQALHVEEAMYQVLWQEYFKSVNIGVRKNTKLHIQHLPTRYWKYLTEKKLKI